MNKIVFLGRLSSEEETQWLEDLCNELKQEDVRLPDQFSDKEVNDIDIAIVANPMPEDLLRYPNLTWVQSIWAGVENLVTALQNEKFQHRQFKLVRLVDPTLSQTMAQSVLAWTLYLQRQMPYYAQQQRLKKWSPIPSPDARDVRVGFLGAGELGQASLALLQNVGYQLKCWTRTPRKIDGVKAFLGADGLCAMLEESDILINLLPLTNETYHLLDKERLAHLPKGGNFINFSRGAVVNSIDLIELINEGHIAHAVLDVFEHEPLTKESEFWSHPNVTVLPHISAMTNKVTASKIVAENVRRYREKNEMPPIVNLTLGY